MLSRLAATTVKKENYEIYDGPSSSVGSGSSSVCGWQCLPVVLTCMPACTDDLHGFTLMQDLGMLTNRIRGTSAQCTSLCQCDLSQATWLT